MKLKRSLSYYEKTYNISNFGDCYLIGEYVDSPDILNIFKVKTKLGTMHSELATVANTKKGVAKGKFDVAIALGMRRE